MGFETQKRPQNKQENEITKAHLETKSPCISSRQIDENETTTISQNISLQTKHSDLNQTLDTDFGLGPNPYSKP